VKIDCTLYKVFDDDMLTMETELCVLHLMFSMKEEWHDKGGNEEVEVLLQW